jgi:hypothetical protein
MRWFFALNEASTSFWDYANLVQVAVHSARRNTTLEPVCLYDGTDNLLTAWLQAAGVTIIRRRTFLHEWVTDLPPIPRGAYLRLEIPAVCHEHGWADEFVLYTDCDVVFRGDPAPRLAALTPPFFAAAPESDPTDFARFNSGVMWINVAGLAAEADALRATIKAHLSEAIAPPYDQAALQRHFADRTDPLPVELNWKPYWGESAEAEIVHFHGPKPAQKYLALNRRLPAAIMRWTTPAYFAACTEWDQLLTAALQQHPWSDAAEIGIADGFDDIAHAAEGLGVPEAARPEAQLPTTRWGLAPATRLNFTTTADDAAPRLEAVMQCSFPDQAVSVRLDGKTVAHLALTRLNDPYPLSVDLAVSAGQHTIEFHYAIAHQPAPPDPRQLGVLFRALRLKS